MNVKQLLFLIPFLAILAGPSSALAEPNCLVIKATYKADPSRVSASDAEACGLDPVAKKQEAKKAPKSPSQPRTPRPRVQPRDEGFDFDLGGVGSVLFQIILIVVALGIYHKFVIIPRDEKEKKRFGVLLDTFEENGQLDNSTRDAMWRKMNKEEPLVDDFG